MRYGRTGGAPALLALCVLWALWALSACAEAPPAARKQPPATDRTAPRPAPRPHSNTGGHRVVAIGDLHGDLDAARRALRLAGAIDARDRWMGGRLVVVQVGDQIDRGDDDRDLLDLFERLRTQAPKTGGAVHSLLGNHELLNALGRMRTVSKGGFRAFARFVPPNAATGPLSFFPKKRRGRVAAFRPGGPYARLLAKRKVVLQLGRTVFVHGGLLPAHVRYGLNRANRETRRFLLGERKKLPEVVWSREGLLWLRRQSKGPPTAEACVELNRALALVKADRIVVGHSRQRRGINSACKGRVWRTDVSLSGFYGKKPAQILELRGPHTRVLTGPSPQ